jgi:hypothetical protein
MRPLGFGFILAVIWLAIPLYWGWMQFSLWGPAVWIVVVVAIAVVTGWRTADRGLIRTCLQALCFAVIGIFPLYFLARLLSGLVN